MDHEERYFLGDEDFIDQVVDLGRRVAHQERVNQLDSRSIATRDETLPLVSERTVTGSDIPSELSGFYNFFNNSIHIATIWQLDPENYVYRAVVVTAGSGSCSVAYGTRNPDQIPAEIYRIDSTVQDALFPENPKVNRWFVGALGPASLNIGSAFFPGSKLHLGGDAGIELSGIPALRTHMISGRGLTEATADLTLSTTATNITGASLGFFTARPNAKVEVTGIFDFECTGAGTTLLSGLLSVDGAAALAREAHLGVSAVGNRATVMQQWEVNIANGADLVFHTFQLQAKKAAAVGTMVAKAVHTTIKAKVLED